MDFREYQLRRGDTVQEPEISEKSDVYSTYTFAGWGESAITCTANKMNTVFAASMRRYNRIVSIAEKTCTPSSGYNKIKVQIQVK